MDHLKSELISNNLLDVINNSVMGPSAFSEEVNYKGKAIVTGIIISHLNDNDHKRICNLREPITITRKLKEFKSVKTNVIHSSIKTRLYQLKLKPREKILELNEKFDAIIRKYESFHGAAILIEQEKQSAYYNAVLGTAHGIRAADLLSRRSSFKEEMKLD